MDDVQVMSNEDMKNSWLKIMKPESRTAKKPGQGAPWLSSKEIGTMKRHKKGRK